MQYPEIILNQIDSLWADKDYAEAQQILEEEFALTQDVQVGLALGKTYMLQYDYNKARRHYHTINELSYRNYESMLNMGRIYNWIGRSLAAENFFQLFLEAFPEDRTGTLELAETQLILNKVAEAQQSLAPYPLVADSDPALAYVHALLHHRQGLYTQAIALATPLLENNDAHFALKARLLVIDAYYQLEYYSKCFTHITIAYQQHVKHLQVVTWYITALNQQGHYLESFNLLNDLQNEQDDWTPIFLELGKLYKAIEHHNIMIVYLEKTLTRGKWYDEGLGQLAYFQSTHFPNEFDLEATIELAQAPHMPKMLFYLGCIYGDVQKDYDQAIAYLEKCKQRLPQYVPCLRKLAEYYQTKGDMNSIGLLMKEILEVNPEHQIALFQQQRIDKIKALSEEDDS